MVRAPPQRNERAQVLAAKDLAARRQEYLVAPPAWLGLSQVMCKRLLHDPRDGPAMWLVLNVICLVAPAAIYLHSLPETPHWLGVVYLVANYALFLQVRGVGAIGSGGGVDSAHPLL